MPHSNRQSHLEKQNLYTSAEFSAFRQPLPHAQELASWNLLLQVCESTLSHLSTTLEEDETALREIESDPRSSWTLLLAHVSH